ncbi:MAG: enoyl-CoA hydratase/isomerase family protein [Acidobacteriota bacterium]
MRITRDPVSGNASGWLDLAERDRVPLLDEPALEELDRGLAEAQAAGATAIVISGGRHGTFAAGADLRRLAKLDAAAALRFATRGQRIIDRLERYPGVLIAAIAGRCIGGAFDLVLACDVRLADTTARFEHPGPRLGFITGYGGTARLARRIGPRSVGLVTGSDVLEAERALAIGLLARIAAPADLLRDAHRLARQIAKTDPRRVRSLKEALHRLGGARRRRRLERAVTALLGAGR